MILTGSTFQVGKLEVGQTCGPTVWHSALPLRNEVYDNTYEF